MRGRQSFDSFDVLYVELTGLCNYRCVHCGNEDDEQKSIDYKDIERILCEFNDCGGKKLILTGGEPLLHPDIEGILRLAQGHGYRTKLSTNASLLNKAQFAYVLDMDLGFRLSLDGTRDVHNRIRRNGKAYDDLVSAMQKISHKGRQTIIRTTVMKANASSIPKMLSELDRLTAEEGINVYSNNIWPMRGIGKANFSQMLSSQEYKVFLEGLNAQTRDLHPHFRIIVGPTFGYEKEFAGGPIQASEIYKCDILNTSLHVASSGNIYPCSFVHYPLGNIRDTSLKNVFRGEKAFRFRKAFLESIECGSCETYADCRGGCIAETYKQTIGAGKKTKDVYCFR